MLKILASVIWILGTLFVYHEYSWSGVLVSSFVSTALMVLYLIDNPVKAYYLPDGRTRTLEDIGKINVWKIH